MFAITFHEFAQNLFTPVSYFVSWLDSVANSLINNYIFQTLLCLTLILSLFWLLYNAITDYFNSKCDEVDNYLDKKKNYELYKQIQSDYFREHRNEEYESLYDRSVLKEQVKYGLYHNADSLLFDNSVSRYNLNQRVKNEVQTNDELYNEKMKQYELNKQIQSDYLHSHHDDEYSLLFDKKVLNEESKNKLFIDEDDLVVDNKVLNYKLNQKAKSEVQTNDELYNEKLKQYELNKQIQSDYLHSHHDDEYSLLFDKKVLNEESKKKLFIDEEDLVVDNKVLNYKLNAKALKRIKEENQKDDDKSNDDEIDYLVPTFKLNKISDELKASLNNLYDLKVDNENTGFYNDLEFKKLVDESNKNILSKYGYALDYDSLKYYNLKTGETVDYDEVIKVIERGDKDMIDYRDIVKDNVSLSTEEHLNNKNNTPKIIQLGSFAYYDKESKEMKRIALPVIGDSLQDFQFDNDNLSDIDRDFISKHTLIRIK